MNISFHEREMANYGELFRLSLSIPTS